MCVLCENSGTNPRSLEMPKITKIVPRSLRWFQKLECKRLKHNERRHNNVLCVCASSRRDAQCEPGRRLSRRRPDETRRSIAVVMTSSSSSSLLVRFGVGTQVVCDRCCDCDCCLNFINIYVILLFRMNPTFRSLKHATQLHTNLIKIFAKYLFWTLFRWFEELGPICELLEKTSEIGVSKIKSPIGSLFQKYVSSSFLVKMRIDLGSFGLFQFILGWG